MSIKYGALECPYVTPPCPSIMCRSFTISGKLRYHFDSIGPAILSAMIVTTLDGWVEIYHYATDAYMVDHQPSENYNVSRAESPTPLRLKGTVT